jgi:Ohr subfamily peroxiredoxin
MLCYASAREAKHRFADEDIQVTAEISLSKNPTDAFVLSASLLVTIAGVDQQTAETLVEGAHHICPYSNAIRGNVDVRTTVSGGPAQITGQARIDDTVRRTAR